SDSLDGGDEKIIKSWRNEQYGPGATVIEQTSLSTFGIAADGTLWVLENWYKYDQSDPRGSQENKSNLITLSQEGETLTTYDLNEATGNSNINVSSLMFDPDGNIYIYGYEGLYVLNADGTYAFSIDENNIQGATVTNTGEVIYSTYGQQTTFKRIDFAQKKGVAAGTYAGNKYFNTLTAGTGDYSFYFDYNGDIYGFKLDTMTDELVVSTLNSDIEMQQAASICALSDGRFILAKYPVNYTGNEKMPVVLLTPDPDASLGNKAIITLGTLYRDQAIASQVMRFNKASTTARIMITDYSQYNTNEDYTAGMTRLDTDILAGRAPDILSLTNGIQASKYSAKGVFEDLYPYLDADPTIGREDLFPNILTAGETDGKLYHIMTGFAVSTLIGKQSVFGDVDHITAAELAAIANKYPDAAIMEDVTSDTWIQISVLLGLDRYVNWTAGTCSFDSPEFIAALEFAKRFPKEIDYNSRGEDYWMHRDENLKKAYAENKILLADASFYDGMRGIRTSESTFGEPVAYMGYPSPEGLSGHILSASSDFAISATSKHKEEAWSFISKFLDVDFVSGGWMQALSANKNKFERDAALEMTPLAERDLSEGLNVMINTGTMGTGTTIYSAADYDKFLETSVKQMGVDIELFRKYELTAEEVAKVRKIISGATMTISQNQQINNIITEETGAFLAGAKTAEETVKIIQSRVALYVSESK
ncbi:MAG: extracellular solute-binding protein, partial [Oscillospiraceae bacterium]|nr:extracellular solute-binding protein [Oscillospiraceae bacterium]